MSLEKAIKFARRIQLTAPAILIAAAAAMAQATGPQPPGVGERVQEATQNAVESKAEPLQKTEGVARKLEE